jgi:hypothetical protein
MLYQQNKIELFEKSLIPKIHFDENMFVEPT